MHLRPFEWDKDDVNLQVIALSTEGYTGAMLANLVNVAVLLCNRDGRSVLTQQDFVLAIDYDSHGLASGQHLPATAKRIAVVEGGVALAAALLPATERVSAVYTQPSEKRRLGQTVLAESEQRITSDVYTRRYLKARPSPAVATTGCIALSGMPLVAAASRCMLTRLCMQERLQVALAGRAAERLLLGADEVSTLSLHYIALSRQIVQRLVLTTGMSTQDVIGPRTLAQADILSQDSMQAEQYLSTHISPEAFAAADDEMQELLDEVRLSCVHSFRNAPSCTAWPMRCSMCQSPTPRPRATCQLCDVGWCAGGGEGGSAACSQPRRS